MGVSIVMGVALFIILIFMGFSFKETIQRAWGSPMTSWNPPYINPNNNLYHQNNTYDSTNSPYISPISLLETPQWLIYLHIKPHSVVFHEKPHSD